MASIQQEPRIAETRRAVLKGLKAYSREKIGRTEFNELAFTVRDKGKIVGGIVGHVWGNTLFVAFLWVDKTLRGKDYGSRLMRKIETAGKKLGATQVYLDTLAYQAPGFYKKLGFTEYGRIGSFIAGHDRIWFLKPL